MGNTTDNTPRTKKKKNAKHNHTHTTTHTHGHHTPYAEGCMNGEYVVPEKTITIRRCRNMHGKKNIQIPTERGLISHGTRPAFFEDVEREPLSFLLILLFEGLRLQIGPEGIALSRPPTLILLTNPPPPAYSTAARIRLHIAIRIKTQYSASNQGLESSARVA